MDEAHGAHLGLFEGWPQSAVQLGADLVVQSSHKTLPSLTQTALLHLGKNSLAAPEEVERQLDIFETSSPSYPLLASLDGCTGILSEQGQELFSRWKTTLDRFSMIVRPLKNLRVLCHGADNKSLHTDIFDFDPSKLVVSTAGTDFTGTSLAKVLRCKFCFETEMACGPITLAMTSAADDPDAVLRFAKALLELDIQADKCPVLFPPALPKPSKSVFTIGTALLKPTLDLPLSKAAGSISGEYIWAYPPGVPLIAPGEVVGPEFAATASALMQSGTTLHHSHCKKPDSIHVLT
ncbi:lysine decarboxylase [gut metagenome]|uniref:Lysine decarboxylase n=1 Tax=gut metagenome TaxID=749906 RepID=J9GVW4_9ZZZZ